jgi:DNA-binding SARP family transcriptional activator/streptogramin lyase
MLEFRALGPIEVVREGQPVELGKGIERALLAILVLDVGRSVGVDEIVEALWGERLPATAREMVRNYVGRLRRRLGPDVVVTTPSGYRLVADADAVDITQFERLASAGAQALERGDAKSASVRLRKALDLWRGRPLPELDESQAYAVRIGALEELRLRVEEDRVVAELALGEARMMIPELEALVELHPYRERLLGQLMLALYRSGRQKDALDRYASARRRLVDEIGLEPGEDLRELQGRILRQDHALNEAAPVPPVPLACPQPRPSRRNLLFVAALTAVAVVVVASILAFRPASAVAVPAHGLVELAPSSGKTVGATTLRAGLGPLAIDAPRVWAASAQEPSVYELGASSGNDVHAVPVPATPFSLAAAAGSLWVGDGFDGTVSRIDARGRLLRTFRPQPNASGRLPLAAGNGQLWVASQDGSLTRLDPTTGRAMQTFAGVGEAESIAVGDHAIWIAPARADFIERFDPSLGRVVRRIQVGGRPSAVVVGNGAVWALMPNENRLWRIDPGKNTVTQPFALPGESTSLASAPGTVWVGSRQGYLATVDTATNTIVRTKLLGPPVDDLASGAGHIWATVG